MGSRKLPSDSEVDFRLWGVGYAFLDWHGVCLRVAWGFALSEFVESGHWGSLHKRTRAKSWRCLDLWRVAWRSVCFWRLVCLARVRCAGLPPLRQDSWGVLASRGAALTCEQSFRRAGFGMLVAIYQSSRRGKDRTLDGRLLDKPPPRKPAGELRRDKLQTPPPAVLIRARQKLTCGPGAQAPGVTARPVKDGGTGASGN